MQNIQIFNSLAKQKESLKPIESPYVGMYVCGPTVYGDPHLGHARAAITFDIVFRALKYFGYKVRYVRNITDVGHLEDEVNEAGEDKIAKKARLEKLEPMEVVQHYTLRYHDAMRSLNCLPPSIEPSATGHIPEQIEVVQKIIKSGYGYESNGSVYFDIDKYAKDNESSAKQDQYGALSGKVIEDLISGTRQTEGLSEKKGPLDFALWKKAKDEHLMKWESPWSVGFPGWHLECTAMSTKYLGETFDIHGGGMDLKFPHHECEIAQGKTAYDKHPANIWMHNNLLTLEGKKMSKSAGNFINLEEFFSGEHELLEQAYSPMTIRFFYLLAHYRSEVDFSNEALKAAEAGYKKLMGMVETLESLEYQGKETIDEKEESFIVEHLAQLDKEIADDFNTAKTLAILFDLGTKVNAFKNKQVQLNSISKGTFEKLKSKFQIFTQDVLGLRSEESGDNEVLDKVMSMVIELRKSARDNKDYTTSDQIRDGLKDAGVQLMDNPDGSTEYKVD